MKVMFMNIARSAVVGLGLLSAGVSMASDHGRARDNAWDNDRGQHSGWDHDRGWRQPSVQVYVQRSYGSRYDSYGPRYDYARVIDVDPIVRRVAITRPQQDCWYEDRQVYGQPRSHTPAVLGAIIGGVIGHQFGHGGSRNAATVAGAALGGSIGYDAARRDGGVETRSVERCEVNSRQDWEDRIDGYRVTYVYGGREYCTDMSYHPGNRVQVRVDGRVEVVR